MSVAAKSVTANDDIIVDSPFRPARSGRRASINWYNPHAILRAKERYDLDLDVGDLKAIAHKVAAGDTMLLKLDRNFEPPREDRLLGYQGKAMRMIYDPITQDVVTFLPRQVGHFKVDRLKNNRPRVKQRKSKLHAIDELDDGEYDI